MKSNQQSLNQVLEPKSVRPTKLFWQIKNLDLSYFHTLPKLRLLVISGRVVASYMYHIIFTKIENISIGETGRIICRHLLALAHRLFIIKMQSSEAL